MNRFEQLIEYVINDEDAKARELFHDIVVEKSREIYENLMAEEAVEEELEEDTADDSEDDEESIEEGMMDNIEADEEQDMSMEGEEDFGSDEPIGGDAQDDFVDNVSADGDDMGGETEPATKDDILNLEDKLDQLMAEFEGLMGGEEDMGDGDGFGPEEGGDAIEMDDTSEMEGLGMFEAVSLKAAPKPVTGEEGSVNKKSIAPANAGAKGPIGNTVKPVHTGASNGGNHDENGIKNATKDLIGRVGNTPAQGTQNLKPAQKPHLGQASGVNTKSPVARS
jgi:hypothetical protein